MKAALFAGALLLGGLVTTAEAQPRREAPGWRRGPGPGVGRVASDPPRAPGGSPPAPDAAPGGPVPGPDGAGGLPPTRPGIEILPEERPWDIRLFEARRLARNLAESEMLDALDSSDDAQVYAVLEVCYQRRLRAPIPDLRRALERSRDERSAYAAAYHLTRHDDPQVHTILVEHVARGMPGHRRIREILGPGATEEIAEVAAHQARREEWMRDAATAPEGSRYQLRAIEALATEPGGDVEGLLRQLAEDNDADVADAAQAALVRRQDAGL